MEYNAKATNYFLPNPLQQLTLSCFFLSPTPPPPFLTTMTNFISDVQILVLVQIFVAAWTERSLDSQFSTRLKPQIFP